jgi:hypothetical protein
MILEKTHNTLKKHEEMLQKSKNTAHEIDAGEEPKNDEAECPDSLKGEGASSASKSEPKKDSSPVVESEDSEMEDEPLSDDESEEDESEEDEEEEKFEFKKSESGMHTVQYKTLKKARVDEGKSLDEKIARRIDSNMIHEGKRGQRYDKDRGTEGKDIHHDLFNDGKNADYTTSYRPGASKTENKKRAIESIKEASKRNTEAHKKNRPNLPKSEDCEYEVKKSESGMHTVQYKTLVKKEQPLKKLMSATSGMPGSVASTGGPSIGSQIGFPGIKKEEDQPAAKENPQYHIRATNEGKAPKKPWTTATRKEVDYSRSGMKGAKPSSPEDQKRFEAEAKERAKKFKEKSAK